MELIHAFLCLSCSFMDRGHYVLHSIQALSNFPWSTEHGFYLKSMTRHQPPHLDSSWGIRYKTMSCIYSIVSLFTTSPRLVFTSRYAGCICIMWPLHIICTVCYLLFLVEVCWSGENIVSYTGGKTRNRDFTCGRHDEWLVAEVSAELLLLARWAPHFDYKSPAGGQQGFLWQWLGAITHEDAVWPAPAWASGLTQWESYLILRKTMPPQKLWRGSFVRQWIT